MRDLEFQALEKKVQKMSRDGLVEQNRATGEEQRISGRLADVSFGKERTADTALGRSAKARASQSSGRASPGRGKPSRELVEKLENPVETAETHRRSWTGRKNRRSRKAAPAAARNN